jgi:hypothetical protein
MSPGLPPPPNRSPIAATDLRGIAGANGWSIIATMDMSKNSLFTYSNFKLTQKMSYAFIDAMELTNLGWTVR